MRLSLSQFFLSAWLLVICLFSSNTFASTTDNSKDLISIDQNLTSNSCEANFQDGFLIKVGDLELDPIGFQIRINGQVARLSQYRYDVFEATVLSADFLTLDELEGIRERSSVGVERNPITNESHRRLIFSHLRNNLKRAFGDAVANRLRNFETIGLYWLRAAEPEEIQAGKLWKAPDRPYFYFDSQIVDLPGRLYSILLAFQNSRCLPLDYSQIEEFTRQTPFGPSPPGPSQLISYIGKINRLVSEAAGTKVKIITAHEYGSGKYALVRETSDFCN